MVFRTRGPRPSYARRSRETNNNPHTISNLHYSSKDFMLGPTSTHDYDVALAPQTSVSMRQFPRGNLAVRSSRMAERTGSISPFPFRQAASFAFIPHRVVVDKFAWPAISGVIIDDWMQTHPSIRWTSARVSWYCRLREGRRLAVERYTHEQ
jgi:hypothetical protein